jgi:gamma-glutamylcysteine synthetase
MFFFLSLLLAVSPAGAQDIDATCLAAAERMIEFTIADAQASGRPITGEGRTAEGRAEAARDMAKQLRAVENCGLVLMLPDSSLRALVKANRPN